MAQNRDCYWSSQKDIWKELKQLCEGATWTCVPLDRRRKDSIPLDAGVYLMCTRLQSTKLLFLVNHYLQTFFIANFTHSD